MPDTRPKQLKQREEYIKHVEESILSSLAISHTKETLVRTYLSDTGSSANADFIKIGNEYVRGVSGGERKRVSIAEVLAGQVSICENPARSR